MAWGTVFGDCRGVGRIFLDMLLHITKVSPFSGDASRIAAIDTEFNNLQHNGMISISDDFDILSFCEVKSELL